MAASYGLKEASFLFGTVVVLTAVVITTLAVSDTDLPPIPGPSVTDYGPGSQYTPHPGGEMVAGRAGNLPSVFPARYLG